jgi:hypothetical protein
VESRFLLDVVVAQGTTVFELFTGKDKTLLVRRNTFLVLNLLLDVVNGVGTICKMIIVNIMIFFTC